MLKQVSDNELFRFLGIEIQTAEADHVVLTMDVTPKVHQYAGIMNGGVSLYLAETAASVGVVAGADLETVTPVGIEINANHLRPVSSGKITVEARPISSGRTISVWSVEIRNERSKLVCVSRITAFIQRRRAVL